MRNYFLGALVLLGTILFVGVAMAAPEKKDVHTMEACSCDSPCSGSKNCSDGCVAICYLETNRCVISCGEDAQATATVKPGVQVASISVHTEKAKVAALLQKVFMANLKTLKVKGKGKVSLKLKNATLADVLKALKGKGVQLKEI